MFENLPTHEKNDEGKDMEVIYRLHREELDFYYELFSVMVLSRNEREDTAM